MDSKPGSGTTFTALLPPDVSLSGSTEASPVEAASVVSEGRVLVADDEEYISRLIDKALKSVNLDTETVADGRDALEKILVNKDDYDLLILDMSMPGLDGDEIFARIREDGIDTPVLFISGHGAHDLDHRVGDAENVAILPKPFRLETLREHCLELLAREARAAEVSD